MALGLDTNEFIDLDIDCNISNIDLDITLISDEPSRQLADFSEHHFETFSKSKDCYEI